LVVPEVAKWCDKLAAARAAAKMQQRGGSARYAVKRRTKNGLYDGVENSVEPVLDGGGNAHFMFSDGLHVWCWSLPIAVVPTDDSLGDCKARGKKTPGGYARDLTVDDPVERRQVRSGFCLYECAPRPSHRS